MRRKWLLAAGAGALIGLAAMPVVIMERALHIRSYRPKPDPALADDVARPSHLSWKAVEVRAADGVTLRAWLFTPPEPNGAAVILLHGIVDSRRGLTGQARFLLPLGYTVLLPDGRSHGVSAGDHISYGIRERNDVHRWADWLFGTQRVHRLYGLGQSMGAVILIQSLHVEPRFRALVADCPFYSFEEWATYRLKTYSGLGTVFVWPVVRAGMLYARVRYGLDLRQASAADAIRATHVPILLIHGTADSKVPPQDSALLHALNPGDTQLWLVPGAEHTASIEVQPEEYARRVVEWFAVH